MPMITLWSAIVRDRRAIRMASGQPVEPVHGDDDVGRLGAGRRAAGAHRHADVRGRRGPARR